MKKGDQWVLDDFAHEQLIIIREDDGMVIFSGCSHHGVLNMVEAAMSQFPETPIKALFGGFHFIGLTIFQSHGVESKYNSCTSAGNSWNIPEKVYTGHCTGRKAYPILKIQGR